MDQMDIKSSNVHLSAFQINTVLFIFLLRRISRVTKFKENKTRGKHVKAWLRRSAMLLPVLGVTWSFGLITFVSSTVVFHYVFTIMNSLQGFFIFINFCILDDAVSYLSKVSFAVANVLIKTQVLPKGIIELVEKL